VEVQNDFLSNTVIQVVAIPDYQVCSRRPDLPAKYYRTSAVSLEKKCSFGRRRVVLGKQGVVLGDNV
jgi:hypothetical protein